MTIVETAEEGGTIFYPPDVGLSFLLLLLGPPLTDLANSSG
jgi:hypothetical protein